MVMQREQGKYVESRALYTNVLCVNCILSLRKFFFQLLEITMAKLAFVDYPPFDDNKLFLLRPISKRIIIMQACMSTHVCQRNIHIVNQEDISTVSAVYRNAEALVPFYV